MLKGSNIREGCVGKTNRRLEPRLDGWALGTARDGERRDCRRRESGRARRGRARRSGLRGTDRNAVVPITGTTGGSARNRVATSKAKLGRFVLDGR